MPEKNFAIETVVNKDEATNALRVLESRLLEIKKVRSPLEHGFADLLGEELVNKRHTESDKEHVARQQQAIYDFVSSTLYLIRDGKRQYIKLIPEALRLVADIFYGRVDKAILWKSRGGGGSTTAAVLIFLLMVYKAKEFTNLAGSGSQARSIYEKVTEFCACNPQVYQYLVDGDPLISRTHFYNGAKLHCINATDKQVRSRHDSGLIVDEGCQEDLKAGEVMKTALQNALTQPDHLILILSTFHHPEGFFQEYWDDAEDHGFTRYKWSVYDTMLSCDLEIDCKECYLTEQVNEHDERGRVMGVTLKGCNGTARTSRGYQEFQTVCDIKKVNEGSTTYTVEFECERPRFYGSIYDIEALADAEWDDITWYEEIEKSVGLDWGYVGQTAVCMTVRSELGVGCLETGWFHEQKIGEIIGYLKKLKEEYGNFVVFADSSDQFSNRELHEEGFKVIPVVFKKWKEFGIQNVSKFLNTGRLQILSGGNGNDQLLAQLRKYRADGNGKPIKKDDHGPDSLMCAMLNWRYFEMFAGSPNLRKAHPEQFEDKGNQVEEIKKSEIDANKQVILI